MLLTSEQLKEKINSGEKMVIKFEASWCGPCKAMKPMFEKASKQLNEQNSNVGYYSYDVEKLKFMLARYSFVSLFITVTAKFSDNPEM